MAKDRMPYARWVDYRLKNISPEHLKDARNAYWSNRGRVAKYDAYKDYCKLYGYDYDPAPNGYWESKEKAWHKPTGILMGLTGVWLSFIASLALGSVRSKGKEW